METNSGIQQEFINSLMTVNRITATELIDKVYNDENGFENIEHIILQSLENIGDAWENGDISLSQVYMSGIICEELIDKYSPPKGLSEKQALKIAIGTLLDHHALGKRMVMSVLKSAGYNIIDLGQGLSVDEMVQKAIENDVEILLISTLMLPSALKVKNVKEKLDNVGSKIKIISGGAPFRLDSNLWKQVGADADGKNATDVIGIINNLVGDLKLLL